MSEDDTSRLKGDLEKLVGTVISHSPISLYDHDQEKLKKKLDTEEMFKAFQEKYIKNFKFPTEKDEFRPSYANNYYGGVDFPDAKTTGLLRGMGWDVVKAIGKKILSGDFNLTTVTIPIKVMIPISILQHICNGHFNFPLYLELASNSNSLEKMKLVMTACLSSWYKSNVFMKPLNPILGETYEMVWEDGSHEYVEQTSHHPPISHFLIYGPHNKYKYYGYLCFVTNAWFNSLKLTNKGKRWIELEGSKITFNYCVDQYSNTFWGAFRHECVGDMEFIDEITGISCKFTLGKGGKLSDYFEGDIVDKEGKALSHFKGSYLSYIEFDGVRYWDIRSNIDIEPYPVKDQLKSSSIYREDSNLLYERKLDEAQAAKEKLENIQRADRKLRAKWVEQHPEDAEKKIEE